jgi:hypothetical protein
MLNQQQIVTSIAAMAKRLGRAPSLLEFVTGACIPKNSVFRLFPRWNDAVRAAGLQPYRLYLGPEDHELLTDWGETVRKLRAVPSRRAYDLNGKHYPITLEKRFGGWPARVRRKHGRLRSHGFIERAPEDLAPVLLFSGSAPPIKL